MLAGRKLLLADDSLTIQKVVQLTFADEGVTVVCFSNGRDAIEAIEEVEPDVVLADVFMPQASGYEVCEYIKQNEKLRHIPVMLLVGSFEPFDEAEARRVGADEILTKPFQSIRGLLEKVGILTGSRTSEEVIPTAELPKPDVEPGEPEVLSEQQLEISTADTRPLPPDHAHFGVPATMDEEQMETKTEQPSTGVSEGRRREELLDLGDFEPASASSADDFVLDIDLDDVPEYTTREAPIRAPVFAAADTFSDRGGNTHAGTSETSVIDSAVEVEATADQFAKTQEFPRHFPVTSDDIDRQTANTEPLQRTPVATAPAASETSVQELSPEMIDAIARRAVEHLSERVVQEIAWEVVPQLAELMIKRQLEEKNS